MNTIKTKIPDLLIFEPKVFGDERGFFMETYNKERYKAAGLKEDFVQDNVSFSERGVLRGLHFQNPNAQGKLVQVLKGCVFDVAVDVRLNSPTFGQHVAVELSAENKRQFYVPPGFAHGFCVTSETALFVYKCTDLYNPKAEHSLLWNDPDLQIDWPIKNATVSEKDAKGVKFKDLDQSILPVLGDLA